VEPEQSKTLFGSSANRDDSADQIEMVATETLRPLGAVVAAKSRGAAVV
jgi:hypothetical protein